jgi:enoyl-[acyl-carrier protein] reductase II
MLPIEGVPSSRVFSEPVFEMMCKENVEVVFCLNMTPTPNSNELKRLKEHGFRIVYRDVNPTLASLLCAEEAGADVLVATGYEAGGHMTSYRKGLLSFLQEIQGKVSKPLAAAGGICNVVGARAVAAAGAEGAYVGTRLLATEENPASDVTKQTIVSA